MVAVLTAAVRFLMPSGAAWLLPLLWASLVRPALSSAAALWTQPERWRALAAFAFLPAYALWRLVGAARFSLLAVGGLVALASLAEALH